MRTFYLIGEDKKGVSKLIESSNDRLAVKAIYNKLINKKSSFEKIMIIGQGDLIKSGRPRCMKAHLEKMKKLEEKQKEAEQKKQETQALKEVEVLTEKLEAAKAKANITDDETE